MRKLLLFLLFLYPLVFNGQTETGSDIVGTIGGAINVSVMGGAIYSVPLELPAGVNGMRPSLGVIYNSQGGNSLLGYGWNLTGISTISRTGSTLFHDGKMSAADLSDDDRFLLDGQRLILVGVSGNNYEYKTENDEFSRITFIKENGYFSKCEVRLENGNIIRYGYTGNSKLMASDGNNVIKWMVSSIADRSGNTVTYAYETSGTNSDLYIHQISYTSNITAGLNPEFIVSFNYSNNRFDDYHYYIAGDKVRCDRLLTRIDVSKGNSVIESYGFTYDSNTHRMYNLLTEISFSKGSYEMRPTVIQWNTVDSDIENNGLYSQAINTSVLDEFTFVGDFNGDGYSDLLTVPYKPEFGYSSDVTAKVYLNNTQGNFSSTPNNTLTLSQYLEWIHVIDINGDGFDDIVAQSLIKHFNGGANTTYTQVFTVYESQQGNGFTNAYSCSIDSRLMVRAGDFIGEGRCGLMLFRIIADEVYDYYRITGCPAMIHYDNGYSLNNFSDSLLEEGVVTVGDYNGDGKTEIVTFETTSLTLHSFYKQNGQYRISVDVQYFSNYDGASYYSGDFNGDGKDDVFFNDFSNHKYVILSTGDSFTDWIDVYNSALNSIVLPSAQTYIYSLNNVSPNASYGINMSDLDGDGKTDVLFYNGNSNPLFFRNFDVTNDTTPIGSFQIYYNASAFDIVFKNQYFTMGNFLGQDHVSFIALDPQDHASTSDDIVKIFTFPSTSARFSVGSITNGMGTTTEIAYNYLMPGQTGFYSLTNRPYVDDVKPCPMPLLAMESYTEHVGTHNFKTQYKYGNALVHRTGRGFVNFEKVEKSTYLNNAPMKLEKSVFELTTMGVNAMALPSCDTTFVYYSGIKILSETNSFTFRNIKCTRQSTAGGVRLIVRPAMISQKTKRFNPDSPGQVLSVELTEYTYNFNHWTYSDSYECTSVQKGINGTDCNSVASCEYQQNTQTNYTPNNYSNWIINRKSDESTVTQFSNQPSVTRKTKYNYETGNPFLISDKTDIPSQSEINPLTVRYSYQHDACGNVISETVSAPYGTHNEAPLVTNYTYNNYRLISSKTKDPNDLSYQDQYSYDNYDRVTSHIGSNGLTTTYAYSNPFSSTTVITEPGNVTTTETTAWAAGILTAPAGALYYTYHNTTGGPETETYYDANGNVLRTLTLNHEDEPVMVDVYFNNRLLPARKSNPYLAGGNIQWTVYQYDGFDRLIGATAPDGTITSNYYNGLTTTTTTTSGQSSRTVEQTTNYLGWVTNNTDASEAEVNYTYYSDGKIETMTTSEGTVTVTMAYDDAGNRVSLKDMDYGLTTSVYDAFGRLVQQNTPKNEQFSYVYDVLGRITQKTAQNDGLTTVYRYNETSHKGSLYSITHNGQTMGYTYDNIDRLTAVTETRSDSTYVTSYEYNANSQISSKTYPSGYKVYYGYFANGTKRIITNEHGTVLWRTNDINASGQLLRVTTGNGAVTSNSYNAATNRLVSSSTSNGIQNFAYSFDGFGNLTSRTDSISGVKTESFAYDNLDRLTGITLNNVSSAIVYDDYGRMKSKQSEGVEVFSSAQFSLRKPHATNSVLTPGRVFPQHQTVEYNSLDKVTRIAQDSKIAQFTYGYDAQRMTMTITDTLTGYTLTKKYVGNCEFVNHNGNKTTYTYLTGPYGVFAVVKNHGGSDEVYYVYKDHLGSWTTVTDSLCNIIERKSFDAWGNPRDPATWTGTPADTPKFDRGFTGHEHLYDFGLINMNGRMYDPLLSAFLSPDNYMQDPTSQQGFNRYAYCMYNPLKYIDPTGELYFGWVSSTYQYEQAAKQVLKAWEVVYDDLMLSHAMTIAMANSLFSHGSETKGNGSGNHGSPGGGGIQVKDLGNGRYEVVSGSVGPDHSITVINGENAGTVIGYYLTDYSFKNENGCIAIGAIIDLNDKLGQDFWTFFTIDMPGIDLYITSMLIGSLDGYINDCPNTSPFDFKSYGYDGDYYALHVSRGMPISFGDGNTYITTARDIGNVYAGFLFGYYGWSYNSTRNGFDNLGNYYYNRKKHP